MPLAGVHNLTSQETAGIIKIMKKILVIDESHLFRRYLQGKLEEYEFEVLSGINGLDGMVKMRSEMPDLIIMDYFLSRKSSLEILKEKAGSPNTAGIPIIMASTRIDKDEILEIAKYGVKKFLNKPLKIDELFDTISEILGTKLDIDSTPCIIEAHFNDEILFIEVARGLNKEKIELLRYKIVELLELYQKQVPKILIIMSDINLTSQDAEKLKALLTNIFETTRSPFRAAKLLTTSEFIKEFIASSKEFNEIEVTDNISKAMDGLLGIKASAFIDGGKTVLKEDFLTASSPEKGRAESILLRYDLEEGKGDILIGAVDDDLVIRELIKTAFSETGWRVQTFENGKVFIESLSSASFDLVFLDLLMPEMNGFEVLEHLKTHKLKIPIIILSVLTQKETVVKALSFGVKSYLIKPLKPENILQKTTEFLRMNF